MKDNKIILFIGGSVLVLALLGLVLSGKIKRNNSEYIGFDNFEKRINKEMQDTRKEIERHFENVEKEIKNNSLNSEEIKSSKVNIVIQNQESTDNNISNINVNVEHDFSNENDKIGKFDFIIQIDKTKEEILNKEEIISSITSQEIIEIVNQIMDKCIKEKLYNATNLNMQYSFNKTSNK